MPQSRSLRRQELLLEILCQSGESTVEELAQRLRVSVWTVRPDLSVLEEQGALQRLHGRARVAGATQVEPWDSASLHQAAVDHLEAEQSISRSVARLIPAGAHVRAEWRLDDA